MIEDLGVCKGPGTILGEFRIGSSGVQLSKVGKDFCFLIDKRTVLSVKCEKDLLSKAVPVIAQVIKKMMKTAQLDELRWKPLDRNYTKLLDQSLKSISENMRPAEIFVLELKPDEITDNSSIDASARPELEESLEDYKASFKRFAETVESLRHGAGILLRTELDKNMWGSKEVMAILGGIKADMEPISENAETVEGCFEHTDGHANFIRAAMAGKAAPAQMKMIIGKAIEGFSLVKSYMSKLAQASQRLYTIDSVFKSRVGYPATWFFNGSIYMDFMFDHENLVDHLIKTASLESAVIDPLLAWKIKLAGA